MVLMNNSSSFCSCQLEPFVDANTETYTEIDFATLGDFLGQDLQELQHTIPRAASKGCPDSRQNVLPCDHLNRQTGQAHT